MTSTFPHYLNFIKLLYLQENYRLVLNEYRVDRILLVTRLEMCEHVLYRNHLCYSMLAEYKDFNKITEDNMIAICMIFFNN